LVSGTSILTIVPTLDLDLKVIEPFIYSIIFIAVLNPRPKPPQDLVKLESPCIKGSITDLILLSEIPIPESKMYTTNLSLLSSLNSFLKEIHTKPSGRVNFKQLETKLVIACRSLGPSPNV
jgi:hypothetical protein